MIEAFFAGFLGVVVGVAAVAYLFHKLYLKEQEMAKELADKFLSAVTGEAPNKKAKSPIDFLSLVKKDKEPPVN